MKRRLVSGDYVLVAPDKFNNLSTLRHPGTILKSITYVNNVCNVCMWIRKQTAYFTDVLTTFLDLDHIRILAVYGGSDSSWISSKIS